MLKKIARNFMLRKIAHYMLCFLWPSYMKKGNELNELIVMKHFFIQRLLRVNAEVNWPVHPSTSVIAAERIKRGSRAPGLSRGCHIDGRNRIVFGENVWIGPHVKIISMNHNIYNYHEYVASAPIVIGDNCWIGAGAIILPCVELGNHTIVGAGAVVNKSFRVGDQIIAGNPAKIVKKINSYKKHDRPKILF